MTRLFLAPERVVVAVVTGSRSGERFYESSPWIIRALLDNGHQVKRFDADDPDLTPRLQGLRRKVAEESGHLLIGWATGLGVGAEDGTMAAYFEAVLPGMPYVGSSQLACAIAMDKAVSRDKFRALGFSVPDGVVFRPAPTITGGMRYRVARPQDSAYLTDDGQPDFWLLAERLGLPFVVKPCGGGASQGLSVVTSPEEFYRVVRPTAERHGPFTVEERIESHRPAEGEVEYTVPLLEGAPAPLPVFEVCAPGVYTTAQKITGAEARPVKGALADKLRAAAGVIFLDLGARGFARIDFRVPPSGELYPIEVNLSPGVIFGWSLFWKACQAIGLSSNEMIDLMLASACTPHPHAVPSVAAELAPPFPEEFRALLPDLPLDLQPPGFYRPNHVPTLVGSGFRRAC
jgi:D-alanine-D-alanine ligase